MTKYFSHTCSLFLVLIFIDCNLSAQSRIIRGMVTDAETHSPIGFCSIILLNFASGITTDATGKFRLSIPEKIVSPKIAASYLGYTTDTIIILPEKNIYAITLRPNHGILNEVVVTGVSKATLIRENPVAIVSVSQTAIEQTIEDNTIDAIAKNAPGLQTVKTDRMFPNLLSTAWGITEC